MSESCACGCRQRAVHQHHILYRQHVRGADLHDPRNLIPLAFACHMAHHARQRVLPVWVLPDGVFEFAAEVLGGPAAHEYFGRYYEGPDERLAALLTDGAMGGKDGP